jgi:hypothetical protein
MRKLKLLAATLAMTLAFATPAFADGVFGDTNLVLGGGTIINDSSFHKHHHFGSVPRLVTSRRSRL